MEIIVSAKTVEAAVALGAEKLGRDVSAVTYEVLEEARKGLFGIGAADARVKVIANDTVEDLTVDFLNTLIKNMGIDAKAEIVRVDERIPEGKSMAEKDISVEINGTGLGMLIGRHGEVLDAIQYLANIAAARFPKDADNRQYIKVSVDVENYRAKREETLKALARRMAGKVVTYKRSITLEPMASYERRIIHSEIQGMKNVHTYSIGSETDRRVVIAYGDEPPKDDEE